MDYYLIDFCHSAVNGTCLQTGHSNLCSIVHNLEINPEYRGLTGAFDHNKDRCVKTAGIYLVLFLFLLFFFTPIWQGTAFDSQHQSSHTRLVLWIQNQPSVKICWPRVLVMVYQDVQYNETSLE